MSEKPDKATASPVREVYPMLCVRGAAEAIEFYKRVFGAEETLRIAEPGGKVGHAELKLGSTTLMLADEYPDYGFQSPLAFGGTGVWIHLHVENVDTLSRRAVEAGATLISAPTDEGHGERQCRLRDPFGHVWLLGHPIESVSPEETQRRFEEKSQQ
jgi:uncharacterized glyoxalase superfamily protein PhnB